jgi:hypothetical protein
MKNTKIMMGLIAFLIILAVSGCGPASSITEVRVHEGTDGLKMNFLGKNPPDEAYEGERITMIIELRNKGAYGIEYNKGLLVLGIEQEYVSAPGEFVKNPILFSLDGRSLYDPIGGFDRKTIPLTVKTLGPQIETITTNVAVTACYPYRTEAAAQVCVDSDIYSQRQQEKVCTPQTLSMGTIQREGQELPRGQGAPIAVTKIEQKMMPHERDDMIKPSYMIYVKNMEDGLPVDIDSYDKACAGVGMQKRTLNVVKANVFLTDRSVQTQLNCTPKVIQAGKAGYIKLEKEEDFIRCAYEEGIPKSLGTYTTPLIIDLDYGYTFTISKSVLLRKYV